MEKLKLNLGELRVEGFATVTLRGSDGTLVGDDAPTIICTEKRSCGHICP